MNYLVTQQSFDLGFPIAAVAAGTWCDELSDYEMDAARQLMQ